jgi:hypothetical protein
MDVEEAIPYFPFVAFRINWVISSGCDTYDAWEALTDILVAFIRSANIRWTSRGIMRSTSEI